MSQPLRRTSGSARMRDRQTIGIALLMWILLLLAIYQPVAAAPDNNSNEPDFAAIDAFIKAEMQAARIPGLALGIVQGERIVHLQGFGVADPSGQPVTPQTPFHIASVTKPFTALAIMQLVEGGKLDLDAPVQRYIPWFRIADPDASARITIRHLLTHMGGLQDSVADQQSGDRTIEQLARDLRNAKLTQPLGTVRQYCSVDCFAVLGLIVQVVSGQPYEEYVQQHIFTPLEMRRSSFANPRNAQHQAATGYRWWYGFPVPITPGVPRDYHPAAGIVSTAEDMSHFLIAQTNVGRYGSAALLSPASLAKMHHPAVQLPVDRPHGLGWYRGLINGVPALMHSGDRPGIAGDIVIVPEGRWGIVILGNANNVLFGMTAKQHIVAGVTSLLVGRQTPAIGLGFTTLYLIIDLVLVALLAVTVKNAVTFWCRRAQFRDAVAGRQQLVRRVVLPVLTDIAVALVLLIGLPQLLSTLMVRPVSLSVMWEDLPDLTFALVVMVVVSLVRAIAKVLLAYIALRRARTSSAVGVLVRVPER